MLAKEHVRHSHQGLVPARPIPADAIAVKPHRTPAQAGFRAKGSDRTSSRHSGSVRLPAVRERSSKAT